MINEQQGRKRPREEEEEEGEQGDEEKQQGRRQPPSPPAQASGPVTSLPSGQENPMTRNEPTSNAFIQQIVARSAGHNGSLAIGGRNQQPQYYPGVASQRDYTNPLIAQRANMPGSLPTGYLQNYSTGGFQPQQLYLQAAAQNPFLLQLLRNQSMLGPSGAQLMANALLGGARTHQRPDPPTAGEGVAGNPQTLNPQVLHARSLLASLQASAVPLGVASVAAAVRPLPAASLPLAQGLPQPLLAQGASLSAAAAARNPANNSRPARRTGDRNKLLYVSTDDESVNAYQCFARKQIELFEATQEDVDAGAQGRNKPIVLGQVGIRCIYCSELHPRFRVRAATYYPSRLAVLYQAAQNIVNLHLPELCESIPEEIRQNLLHLNSKRSAVGGGKTYWCDTARAQGVVDTGRGLRYGDNPLPPEA